MITIMKLTTCAGYARRVLQANLIKPLVVGLAVAVALIGSPGEVRAAGPALVDLGTAGHFTILAGAAITTTGGGIINGDIGASPIAGSAIGVGCAQINGTIYAVDASGPPCAVIAATLLTTAKGDLTTAYNDAAGRTPTPTGPNLNPGLIPGSGNIGGMNLAPGLYKFTVTALITGSDVTLTGGPNDVWIFQCAQDLQLGSGMKVILAGGAQANHIFWQVGTSAVLGTGSVFNGIILADQAITMNTSSTLNGQALAFSAGVTFNGNGAIIPVTAPGLLVQQPLGMDLTNGVSTNYFGVVVVGTNSSLTFTITNTGTANLTNLVLTLDGADAASFTVTTNPVAPVMPASNTTFTVRFTPLSAGTKLAGLHLSSNDTNNNPFNLTLTGTGFVAAAGLLVQQPLGTNLTNGVSTNNFGSVIVGTNSSLTFTITNTGTANLTGLVLSLDGADAASFSVTTNPVAPVSPGSNTTFTVRFAPLTSGVKLAGLHLASNDTNNSPFNLTLTGTGTVILVTAPGLAVQQPLGTNLTNGVSTNNFGSVLVGTNSSLTFTITNTGTANLTGLVLSLDGADAASFTVTTNPVAPVSPGSNTTFTVRFTPLSAGTKLAGLHLASNDTNNSPFNLTLTGTGTVILVTTPGLVVQQPLGTNLTNGVSTNNFGSVLVGTNSSLTFTITNTGTANLTGLVLSLDGADAASFTVTTNPVAPVSPGGNTTFTVRFAPVTSGVKLAGLHLASNDTNNSPFNLALTGMGTLILVTAPVLVVQQPLGTNLTNGVSTNNFGSVIVGTNSSLTFTITNTGTANLTGLVLSLDGADAASFTVTTNPVAPVSPGGNTTFTVRFAPLTSGVKLAGLHLASNDTNNSPFNLTLTGTGTVILVTAPGLVMQQPLGTNLTNGVSTNNFGSVIVGTNNSLTFTITNTGTANLTGLVLSLDGADAASFTVTTNPVSPVTPGGKTTFTVRFAPLSPGVKTATLHLASNDTNNSPFNLPLIGTGVDGGSVYVVSTSSITLNPQTGLFEQTVRVTNSSFTVANGLRLLILDLPIDVQVYNASGSTNSIPFVQYGLPLASGGAVNLLIEYYRANRQAIPMPTFVLQVFAPMAVTETGPVVVVDRSVQLESGRFLIEFSAIPGRRYAVQYSSDLETWLTAVPTITAPANRVQWYDDGPPKTESKPSTSGSRYYRIQLLP